MLLLSIFGNPVSHSISPRLHNNVIHHLGIDGCYVRKAIENPADVLATFHAMKLDGANVTVPHKEVAFEQCDEVRGIAKEIGAINTLVKENGKVIGYNTDAPGFFHSIASLGSIKRALILGAGGTAKALALILKENHVDVTVLNRSASRLQPFLDKHIQAFSWENFEPKAFDIIINTTSAGLKDEEYPCEKSLLEKLLPQARFAYDVIYHKQTPFMKLADDYKLICKDGKEMLLYQAVLAFELFTQHAYDFETIEALMRPIFEL